jgi:lysophospholipase L1-like esterase
MKLYYANNSGSAGFRYRLVVNGTPEEWKTVLTNGIAGLGTQTLNVQSYAAPYMIDIEALGVGVSLIGAEAVKTGNGIVAHKLGCSGGRAIHFAANDLAKAALNELNLDMAVIMFGTNEQGASQTPASFKTALQTLITSLRTQNPNMDLLLMLPCYTKYELEDPKPYKLQDYGTVMRELATANKAAFMDFTEVFGPAVELQNLINSGLMNADRVHPTTTGVGSGGFLIGDAIYVNVLTSP